jgi:gliding motility-associated-like protein
MKGKLLKLLSNRTEIKINTTIVSFLLFIIGSNYSYSQLFTKEANTSNIDSLVHAIFGSPNVQIFNITFDGEHFPIGAPNANIKDIGIFNSINSTVGIDEGLILTGGYLVPPYGLGQPASVNVGFWKMTDGDSLLDSIIYPYETEQAAVLEFDFIPNGDSIKFNYVFASDEYPNQICSDDFDLFAFHVSGPSIVGNKNIALIPGTNFPVGINTVNDTSATPYWPNFDLSICPTIDFPQYYVDHTGDQTFVFNGSSTVLTAKIATTPCETYHLRLAIAEGGGNGENSAVFLESNSFNSEPISIESDISYGNGDTLLYEGCGFAKIILKRTYNIQHPKNYTISLTGSAVNGIDYNSISTQISMVSGQFVDTIIITPSADFIADNMEDVIITIGDTLCNGQFHETSLRLVIYEKPNYSVQISPNSGSFCDEITFTSEIQGAIHPITYNWNNGLCFDSIYTYYPVFNGDYEETPILLATVDACDNSANDSANVIFSHKPNANFSYSPNQIDLLNSTINFNSIVSNDVINWIWSFQDDNSTSYLQSPIHFYLDTGSFIVSLKVSNQFNCTDSIAKTIRINEIPNLYIPNSFTPNGDGINDVFQVIGNRISEFNIQIFNRWGEEVFISNNQNIYWNGENVSIGTYSYKVNVRFEDGKQKSFTGSVVLIR